MGVERVAVVTRVVVGHRRGRGPGGWREPASGRGPTRPGRSMRAPRWPPSCPARTTSRQTSPCRSRPTTSSRRRSSGSGGSTSWSTTPRHQQLIPHHDLEAAAPRSGGRSRRQRVRHLADTAWPRWPHLRATRRGCIINISSLAGSRPGGSSIPYAASKAAVNHMTRAAGQRSRPQIRVKRGRARAGGHAVDRRFTGIREHITDSAPLHRVGTPEDIGQGRVATWSTPLRHRRG